MKAPIHIKLFAIAFFTLAGLEAEAQSMLSVYTDFGSNNVSRGTYNKIAGFTCYSKGKTAIEAGFQTDVKNKYNSGFSGFSIKASRIITLKHLPIEINGFYVWLNPAGMLVETNWGVQLMVKQTHLEFSIGTDFRSFSLKSLSEGGTQGPKIHEIYNMIYSFSYYLKPTVEKWNIGLTLTNVDHFMINQETNPLVNLGGLYKITSHAELFIQTWYKDAGLTNLTPNKFGLFLRTGIVWNLN